MCRYSTLYYLLSRNCAGADIRNKTSGEVKALFLGTAAGSQLVMMLERRTEEGKQHTFSANITRGKQVCSKLPLQCEIRHWLKVVQSFLKNSMAQSFESWCHRMHKMNWQRHMLNKLGARMSVESVSKIFKEWAHVVSIFKQIMYMWHTYVADVLRERSLMTY